MISQAMANVLAIVDAEQHTEETLTNVATPKLVQRAFEKQLIKKSNPFKSAIILLTEKGKKELEDHQQGQAEKLLW